MIKTDDPLEIYAAMSQDADLAPFTLLEEDGYDYKVYLVNKAGGRTRIMQIMLNEDGSLYDEGTK